MAIRSRFVAEKMKCQKSECTSTLRSSHRRGRFFVNFDGFGDFRGEITLPEVVFVLIGELEQKQLRVGGFLKVCRVPVVDRAGSVLAF